jgi:hypothetical protein
MVRVPAAMARAGMAGLAGSGPRRGLAVRRIPSPDVRTFSRLVTVDLGNDGMAPLATFGAGGGAEALAGPSAFGESWSLDQCFLSTSVGPLDAAECLVYVGPGVAAQYAVTGSLSGGGSQFGMGGVGLTQGWFVWAVWSGGTEGATASLRVTGTKTVLTN